MSRGVAAGALVTACAAALLLWIDLWVVAMVAVLHTHDSPAILAVVAGLFLFNALLVFLIASGRLDDGDDDA